MAECLHVYAYSLICIDTRYADMNKIKHIQTQPDSGRDRAYIHKYTHTCIHIDTYIHMYIYTHIHMHILTYIQTHIPA